MSWPKFGQNLKNTSLSPYNSNTDGTIKLKKALSDIGSIPKCKATKALRRRRISVVNPIA